MAAPLGNKNSSRENRLWGETIRRAAVQDAEKLRRIADKLFALAEDGDIQAMREIGDRLDGKPHQTLDAEVSGNLAGLLAGLSGKTEDTPLEG